MIHFRVHGFNALSHGPDCWAQGPELCVLSPGLLAQEGLRYKGTLHPKP